MTLSGDIFFILFATIAVFSAVGTVGVKTPIRAAMSLLLHIASLAALYLTLNAHFLAAMQLIVYAGAVVVLFVFVIMLIGPMPESRVKHVSAPFGRAISIFGMGAVTLTIAGAISHAMPAWVTVEDCAPGASPECNQFGGVRALGTVIFDDAIVPFELASILLLVAIVGAIAVARGRSLQESRKLAGARAVRDAADEKQKAYEQKLAAEVSAHGGH